MGEVAHVHEYKGLFKKKKSHGGNCEQLCTIFFKIQTDKDCHHALHYITYEAKKSKKEDMGFIFWDTESEPFKNKIIFASSKDSFQEETDNDQLWIISIVLWAGQEAQHTGI